MKEILIFFSFLFLSKFYAFDEKGVNYSYWVDSTKTDSTLQINEAVFTFTFHNVLSDIPKSEIRYAYNGLNQVAVLNERQSFDVKLEPGMYVFEFYYSSQFFEIRTDSIKINGQQHIYATVFFQYSETEIMVDKPVIYFYPEKTSNIDIQLKPKGNLTFTYPEYNEGWKVKADPTGELKIGNNSYNYLFWESSQQIDFSKEDYNEGFIVDGKNASTFLEEQLDAFGLNSKEKADFITFWGPQLGKNKLNFVHFVLNEDCDQFAELNITPKPDNIYRIYILTCSLNENEIIVPVEQKIEKIDRTGFTVIEWGGSQIPQIESL